MKKFLIILLVFLLDFYFTLYGQDLRLFGGMGFSGNVDQPVLSIAGGGSHSLVLKDDGTVVAWGRNTYGQVTVPPDLSGVIAISAGFSHSIALKDDRTVVAWGYNNNGQVTIPTGLSGVIAISAGRYHTLALKEDGTVVAWGDNTFGQVTIPSGLTDVIAISAGSYHNIAIKQDGTIVAWGLNSSGQTRIPLGLGGVKSVAAGGSHSLAVKEDGTVVAWGSNSSSQTVIPTGLSGVKAISAGYSHNIALKEDGTVVAWGDNYDGQIRIPLGLTHVKSISAGASHSLALKEDGNLVAWGDNYYGQTTIPTRLSGITGIACGGSHSLVLKDDSSLVAWGSNTYGQTTIPSGLSGLIGIAAGGYHSLALKADGTLVAWGYNNFGQITIPSGLSNVIAISAGIYHSLALKGDGTVVAWGYNNYGQVTIPPGLSDVIAISAGYYHNLALKENGTVVAWGLNNFGQTNIPADLSGVIGIAGGNTHSLALKQDGTVMAWGLNNYNQITIPTGLSGIKAIAVGLLHSLALKEDGMVVAWGNNSSGQTSISPELRGVKAIGGMGNTTICLMGGNDTDTLKSTARGRIIRDNNFNCTKDSNEYFIQDLWVKALPGPVYGYSNSRGDYALALDTNVSYTIKPIIPSWRYHTFQNNCDTAKTVSFARSGIDSSGFDFHIKYNTCHYLTVDVASDRRRRCFKSNTTVRYCNAGAATAKNVQIFVEFPTFVRLVSSNWNYTQISDSLYRFDIDSVTPNYCGQINIVDSVVCDNEEIIGLTQCTKTWITPVNNCTVVSGWDKSNLQVTSSYVDTGAYQVKIFNSGTGDMDAFRKVKVEYGRKLVFTDSVKINLGDTVIYSMPFNGKTIRVEVDQHPEHPYNKAASVTMENCGANKIVQTADKGLTLTYPLNDEEPERALDCQVIRDSYDPNDKQAVPAALLPPGKPVDYMIRFQNTGNDTAYTVIVVDTLDERFDMASFQISGSSHPYSFKLSGTKTPVLKFTYNYINLPDSTTNEPKSYGYIKFRITPMDTVPEESILKNKAEIYFDFNSAIVTNTVILTLKDSVATEPGTSLRDSIKRVEVISALAENLPTTEPTIYPNPNTGEFTLKAAPGSNYILYSLTGHRVQSGTGTSTETIISAAHLPKGIYLLQITNSGGVWMKKVVVQ